MAARKICLMLAIGATCAGAGGAEAAIVHRCRAADGALVYRDAPCPGGETTIDRRVFDDPAPAAGDAPPHAGSPRGSRASSTRGASAWVSRTGATGQRGASASSASASPAHAYGGPARTQRSDRIVAHECRFGEQRWIQAGACPRSLALAGRDGKATRRGVDETRLTAAQVCRALRDTSSADAPGEGSARRGYGMNRLRQLHGC